MKTYAAQSGYVLQYFYRGMEERATGDRSYHFDVSHDRRTWWTTVIRVEKASIAAWEAAHGRTLASNELYGLAKMGLFAAFDRHDSPPDLRGETRITPGQFDELLAALGIE